jgi:hypothetical protein
VSVVLFRWVLLAPVLAVLLAPSAAGAETTYLAVGAQARWSVTPPGTGWTARDFDDRAWTVAPTPLVGEARAEPTGSPAQRVPSSAMTVFVRMPFHVGPEGARLRSLALRARFEEGVVAWIDGREVARRYVAPGAPPDAPSEQIHGTEPETFAIPVRGSLGSAGEHLLALEVHAHKPNLGPVVEVELAGYDALRLMRGPYLLRPGATEMTVAWATDLEAPGEVRYGGDTEYGSVERSPLLVRQHILRLRGLHPSRVYHYKVIAGGTESHDLIFHTLPTASEPLRFVVYGDVRSGHPIHARLVEQVMREDPDFVLSVGDLVDRGSEESEWQRFFEVAAPLLHVLPLVPALGNHDVWRVGEGALRFLALFPPPAGAPEPGYYSFDAAGVHFTVLDSNQLRSPRQLQFCEADLARAQRARARFVAMHQGPWSMGFHGNLTEAIKSYVPLFQRYHVTLILSGHDHDYERGRQAGLDYIVSGGGGAPLYAPRCGGSRVPCPASTFLITPEYHYVLVEVQRDSYRICARRLDGSALEPCVDSPLRGGSSTGL